MIVDELARLRAELAQLKEKEQYPQDELSRIRVEIEAHSSRIEHIVWAKAPINSLPSEILVHVLELAALSRGEGDKCDFKIHDLQLVSRYWRDNIRSFPKFWSHIYLVPSTKVSLVKTYVTRSGDYPLDVTIEFETHEDRFTTYIDLIVPHVHRWSTLRIGGSVRLFRLVLDKINHLKFPSLTHAAMRTDRSHIIEYPTFLKPENSPSLKRLGLRYLIPMGEFSPGQSFTDISLGFTDGDHRFGPLTLPFLLSSQKLTTLDLVYSSCPTLPPNNISLPLLNSLTLHAGYPRELLTAMVTPQLSYFSLSYPIASVSTIFHGLESKFCSVRHLVLRLGHRPISDTDTQSISLVFSNVHHLVLGTEQVDDFFEADPNGSCVVDRWRSLESLTFYQIFIEGAPCLERWLRCRNLTGLPMLRVKFVDCTFLSHYEDDKYHSTPRSLLYFHNQLRGACILDIVDDTLHTIQQISSQTLLL